MPVLVEARLIQIVNKRHVRRDISDFDDISEIYRVYRKHNLTELADTPASPGGMQRRSANSGLSSVEGQEDWMVS